MKLYSHVLDKMEGQGGGFASALAVAYGRADATNAEKLENEFSDLFELYEEK